MVIHVGMDLRSGKISSYDSLNKEYNHFKILEVNYLNERERINVVFKKMSMTMKGEFGCACIFLPQNLEYKPRNYILNMCLLYGFKKAEVIDDSAALFYSAIQQTNDEFKSSENVLISSYSKILLWQKDNELIESIPYVDLNFEKEIKEKVKQDPSIIFYYKTLNYEPVKELFPHSNFLSLNYQGESHSALIKARMISDDSNHFVVRNRFKCYLTLTVDDAIIADIKYNTPLPLTKKIVLKKLIKNRSLLLKLNGFQFESEKFELPYYEAILILLKIDNNGIYNLEFQSEDITNNNKNDNPVHIDFVSQYVDISDCYIFPKKLLMDTDQMNAIFFDLGTTRCCAAVNRKGGIETVVLDNIGQRLLPSYVAFDEKTEKCGQIVIDRLRNYGKSTVFDAKRMIGKEYIEIKPDDSWPFKLEELHDRDKKIYKDNEYIKKPFIKFNSYKGIQFQQPEIISAVLLKHIKSKAEEFQGKQLVDVVITVPAAFNDSQNLATLEAAKYAGWENVRLFPEPVAAAFSYFINNPIPNNSTFLLFDLGGGTLDVCIFKIKKRKLQIISRSGDPNLGGRDFDNLLVKYFKKKLIQEFKVTISENQKYKFMQKCQNIKESLSLLEQDALDVDEIDSSVDGNISITRNEFEILSAELINKINDTIKLALDKINFKPEQIKKVLQFGGGCRMPMIKKILREQFPSAEHICEKHPEEVVAVGAAYYACYLNMPREKNNPCSIM